MSLTMQEDSEIPDSPRGCPSNQFLCLTICGYRRPGMSEEDYRHYMTKISAPTAKGLFVQYGIKRWTLIHNTSETRGLMGHLFDRRMANLADFDCFSLIVFKTVDDFKRMKQDPMYKEKLAGHQDKFADTKRSMMTIGWVTEMIRDGEIVDS